MELNFLQKGQGARLSISPPSRVDLGGSKDWHKYYNILKCKSRLTLGLKAAKNTALSKKVSNKSCAELNFPQKTQ